MKNIILVFSIIFAGKILAQKPETVLSFAREKHEISWYEEQQKLWKQEIDKNKTNGEAWHNYFRAKRALLYLLPWEIEDKKQSSNLSEKLSNEVNAIVEEAYAIIPNSFEANLMKAAQLNLEGNEFLKKAYEINPYDVRTFDGLMVYYETIQEKTEFQKFATKMFQYNVLPSSILNWGYNILSELDENAILFTAGDNDTYACWIAQEALNFRNDVQIINTSLILSDDYRNRIFKKMNLPALSVSMKKVKSNSEYDSIQEVIFKTFINGKRNVYTSASAYHGFKENYKQQLFLTGLAYKFSEKPIETDAIIRRNYEKRYLLDHLKQSFSFNVGDNFSIEFNSMYLPSMLQLYKFYQESEETFKMKELENLLLLISEKSGQQSEILEVLSEENADKNLLSAILNLKDLEKNMISLKENIFINKFEISNKEYTLFLENLKRSNQMEKYYSVLYDSSAWSRRFNDSKSFYEPMENMYNWHPGYTNYPLVNVKYEDAIAYCEWLSKQYNLQRNRTYTQVRFRLPTEKEWNFAAGSGNEKAQTCFEKDNAINDKKQYLANFKSTAFSFHEDGGFSQVTVNSYKPNKMGLYCMFGNVSEMISDKGIAKGGSWYNLFEECNFQKKIIYEGADCGVGFRIVMEVIEK